MRHGLTLRKAVLVGIVLLSSITILFSGIIEETSATLEVGGIVDGSAGVSVFAQKGLWHGQFGNKGVGNRLSIREGASWNVHVAGLFGNVAGGGAPGIQAAIEGTKNGFFINRFRVAAGWIELSSCGKYHVFRGHGSSNGMSTGYVLFADFYQGTEILW